MSDRRSKIEELFEDALARPPAERRPWLEQASGGDYELCAEVEQLLSAHERATGILERPVREIAAGWLADSERSMDGHTVGPYRIQREIGRGGMGIVYQARHLRLGRVAALKFLPPHLAADAAARERFIHEARAASALDHPNICTIYDIGEAEDGRVFLAMARYDGRTLREELARGPLPIDTAVDYAAQIARALKAAHASGIVHRDLKPANLMITGDGRVKLLDFGLAKLAGQAGSSQPGLRLGTVAYMSPEQARGEPADHRSDIWALGVVLHEMLTGERPFAGETEPAVLRSILDDPAPSVTTARPDVPPGLAALVRRSLEKNPARRYQSAAELLRDLEPSRAADGESAEAVPARVRRLVRSPRALVALAAILVLAGAVLVPYWRQVQHDRAVALLPRIEDAALAGSYLPAYRMAEQAEEYLAGDSTLARLLPVISDHLTVTTRPAGARVYLRRFAPDETGAMPDSVFIGRTPIRDLRVARGDYRVIIRRAGFVPIERVVSSAVERVESQFFDRPIDIEIEATLLRRNEVPANMVLVPGGSYRLVGGGAPTTAEVMLEPFLIDRYEVSNEEYRDFILAGGYETRAYWTHPFIEGGVVVPWQEAMRRLTDRTGLPGPRHWTGQEYPSGAARKPVTNITWYEAAAYAEYAGKRLPTAFEWEKAARDGRYTRFEDLVMPWGLVDPEQPPDRRANFSGAGAVAVDSYPFGISPYGAYNMAGNAQEWVLNKTDAGHVATGGSWRDPMYVFSQYGSLPGFFASPTLGFRCARGVDGDVAGQHAMRIDFAQRTPSYTPVDEETFRGFLSHYRYDDRPLRAEVVAVEESADWTRETIRYDGVGDDRVLAYLYVPKRATPPFQTIVFVPGSGAFFEMSVPEHVELLLPAHIRAGRAVLAVVFKGMIEREWDLDRVFPDPSTVRFRELMVLHATELSRGIDYLETRDDIDTDRLAYLGVSWGSGSRLVFAAVDDRYRSVVFLGGGIDERVQPTRPEASNINFAPYIGAPTLMLNGRYDEEHPYLTRALPLWNLLREPKEMVIVDGGHIPPAEARVPVINEWLDETLGPVRRE